MDPVSIISLVEACSSFSFTLGKLIVALVKLAGLYKQIALTIQILTNECKTISVVITKLHDWVKSQINGTEVDAVVWGQLRESLQLGELVVAAFEEELRPMNDPRAVNGFRRKTRATWALSTLKEHENRVRGQFGGLTLLLQIVSLPSPLGQAKLLEEEVQVFRTASESARTILDSNASISTWRASAASVDSLDMSYKPLDFDNLLFTSYVYKRNFRIKRAIRTKKPKVIAMHEEHASFLKPGDASGSSIQSLSTLSPHGVAPGFKEDQSSSNWSSERQWDNTHTSISKFRALESTVLCPTDESPAGKLIQAIRNGALEPTKKTIAKVVSMNRVYQGKISSTLPWGAPVDHRSYTLLQLAVGMEHVAIVALLLNHGAEVDLRTSQTSRPIVVACQSGNVEVTELLVKHGAFIDCHTVDDDHGPIHAAVASGNTEMVRCLCKLGASTESETKSTRYTALELACLFEDPLALECLLEMGAKPFSSYSTVSWIRQPHVMAMLEHNDAVVEKLAALDPSLFSQTDPSSGSTALHELFEADFSGGRANFLAQLRLLLRHPRLVSIPDKSGNLPLHIASSKLEAHLHYARLFIDEVICILVAEGADVLALNGQGHDALYLACQAGGEATVASLLKCGAVVCTDSEHQSHYGAILRADHSLKKWQRIRELLNETIEKQSCQHVAFDQRHSHDVICSGHLPGVVSDNNSTAECDMGSWI